MRQQRISKTTTISLPPSLYQEVIRMAKTKGMTKSEMLRAAWRRYSRQEHEWADILAYGRRKAEEAQIRNEEDVERLIDEIRAGKA
ncbi:MAG: ribbon-helix-helix protein, CopG family [Elusimicrobiota bacterium]